MGKIIRKVSKIFTIHEGSFISYCLAPKIFHGKQLALPFALKPRGH